MTQELREKIYREMQHSYYVADAINQVNDYIENVNQGLCSSSFNYDRLADLFEERKDCNVADNDTWQSIIGEYAQSITDKRNQEIENMPFKYFYDTDSEQALTVEQVYESYLPLAGVEYDSFEDFCDCITGMGSQCKGFCTLEELKAFVLEYTCEDVKWFTSEEEEHEDEERKEAIEKMPFKYFYNCDLEQIFTVEQVYDDYLNFREDGETFEEFVDYISAMDTDCYGFCTMEELNDFMKEYEYED